MSFGIWQRTITDDAGNVLPGASIEVRAPSSNFTGALVSLFSNEGGTTGLSNPFNADSEGFAQFYAAPRKVDIRATGSGLQRTWRNVEILGTAAISDVQTSPTDTTAGRLMAVGAFGLDSNLGTMSTQNANNVSVSGGSVSGISLSTPSDALINGITVGSANAVGTTALGFLALSSNPSVNNTGIGNRALENNTTAVRNTAVGAGALRNSTTGGNNTGIGRSALRENTTGVENLAVGYETLLDATTGSNNIGIGRYSGNIGDSPFGITTQDNRIVIGNNFHTDAYIRIAFTVTSDARDKAEISPVPLGLDFVNQLEPTEYQFKAGGRDGEPDGRKRYGFLAQDVLAAEGSDSVIVDDEDEENLKLHESYLVPVLVNAIKELTARIEELENAQ